MPKRFRIRLTASCRCLRAHLDHMHHIRQALVIDTPGDFPVAFGGESVDAGEKPEVAITTHVILSAQWWGGGVEAVAFDRELAGDGTPPRHLDAIAAVRLLVACGDDEFAILWQGHVEHA